MKRYHQTRVRIRFVTSINRFIAMAFQRSLYVAVIYYNSQCGCQIRLTSGDSQHPQVVGRYIAHTFLGNNFTPHPILFTQTPREYVKITYAAKRVARLCS
jgi:hypothetical protein